MAVIIRTYVMVAVISSYYIHRIHFCSLSCNITVVHDCNTYRTSEHVYIISNCYVLLTWCLIVFCRTGMQLTDTLTLMDSLLLMAMVSWPLLNVWTGKINQDIEFTFLPLTKVGSLWCSCIIIVCVRRWWRQLHHISTQSCSSLILGISQRCSGCKDVVPMILYLMTDSAIRFDVVTDSPSEDFMANIFVVYM